jgi:AraC-like DNA-binding protein
MIETVFRTEDLPASDRFEFWADRMAQTHAPLKLRSDHAAKYWAYQRVISLGALHIWPTSYQPLHYHRTAKLIRQSDPEQYHVALPLQGTNRITWDDDQQAAYGPYEIQIYDSSRIFKLHSDSDQGLFHGIGVEIPKAALPLPRNMDTLAFQRGFSGREGIGGLLAQFLTQLSADTSSLRPADAPRLATVLTDLLTALFAPALEAQDSLEPGARQRTLILQIRAFIAQNLTDPDLAPGAIAAAHHISRSYLHRLFRDEEETVGALIRRQRMERACRDLADPAQHATPIHTIAARWGFRRPADFTRAFRTAYGTTPTGHRRQALPASG